MLLPATLPDPIAFESQRAYVREALARGVDNRANGMEIVPKDQDSPASIAMRERLNREGSPSEIVAAGYRYVPGTELTSKPPAALEGPAMPDFPSAPEDDAPFVSGATGQTKKKRNGAQKNGGGRSKEARR
jgi:hypothetical protein